MPYAHSAQVAFGDMLGTLDHLLGKAQAAGMADEILSAKLAEDMFPLELQIRVAVNQALLALNQGGGASLSLEDAPYRSLAHARERVAAVRARIGQSNPDDWHPAGSPVDLTLPDGVRFAMSAEEDVRDWLLPNCYFHVTMSYALLRMAGLSIGKMDFVPHMARHKAAPSS